MSLHLWVIEGVYVFLSFNVVMFVAEECVH